MTRIARVCFFVFTATLLALFGYGLTRNWPWLISENARLEPWKVPIIWAPVACSLLLFLEFGVSGITGAPVLPQFRGITLKAFIASIALECALVGYSIIEERSAHSRAVRVQGQVIAGHSRTQSVGNRRYTFICSFSDARGKQHFAWFSEIVDDLPASIWHSIDRGEASTANIAYDPQWPGRHWLADKPYTDDNRLFLLFLLGLLFALPLTAGLASFRRRAAWLPTPRIAPFLGITQALCMGAALQGGW